MIRTQVSLDADLYQEARAEARRRGISFAELCRRALAGQVHRDPDQEPWMRYAGALESSDSTPSRSVDEVVYGRERP